MRRRLNWFSIGILGAVEALLLARLVLRLLAARPDNPTVAVLYALTGPMVGLLAPLDSGQPRFGSVLELSTLTLVMILLIGGAVLARVTVWRRERRWRGSYNE